MKRLACPLALVFLVAGCGDDDDVPLQPDAGPDAGDADAARPDAGPMMCPTTPDAGRTLPTPDPAQNSCGVSRVVNLDAFSDHDGYKLRYAGTLPATARADLTGYFSNATGKEVVHGMVLAGKADIFATSGGALSHTLCWVTSCVVTPARLPSGQCSRTFPPGPGANPGHGELIARGVGPGPVYFVVDAYDAAASVAGRPYTLDLRVRPVLPMDAPCDPFAVVNRCDSGLSCHGQAGAARCASAVYPTLVKAAVLKEDGVDWYTIDAMSADGDVESIRVESLSATGTVLRSSDYATEQVGVAHFRARPKGNGSASDPMYRIRLIATSGLESAPATLTSQPMPIRAPGEACDGFSHFDRCAAGARCVAPGGFDGTCVAGKVPSLTALAAYTLPDGSRRLVVDGDDDGDHSTLELTFLDAGGNPVVIDVSQNGSAPSSPTYAYLQHSEGTSTFRSMRDIPAVAFAGATAVTQVRAAVWDLLGQASTTLTATFVPIAVRAAGESCDTFGRGDLCQGATPLLCDTTCKPLADLRAASCAAATPLSFGVPVVAQLPRAASRFGGNCGRPEAAEAIFTIDVTEPMDLAVGTVFPETVLDTIVTIAPACDSTGAGAVCHDSVSSYYRQSIAVLRDARPGRYYVFVDAWSQLYANGGVGTFKVEARARALTSVGASCDPEGIKNRCACGAGCAGDGAFASFSCR